MSLASFRSISGKEWVQADVSHRYDTPTHTKWVLSYQYLEPWICVTKFIALDVHLSLDPFYRIEEMCEHIEHSRHKGKMGVLL